MDKHVFLRDSPPLPSIFPSAHLSTFPAMEPTQSMEETNPILWETEQRRNLNALADESGWDKDHKEFKARLKYILKEAVAKRRSSSSAPVVKRQKHTWPKIKKWIRGASGKYADHHAAKVGLLVPLHAGKWVGDLACPNSEAEEKQRALRYINKEAVGGPYLARLVDLGGTGKKWRVDQPQFVTDEGTDEEDPGGDDEASPDDANKEKNSGKGGSSKAADPKPTEQPVDGAKRKRKHTQKQ